MADLNNNSNIKKLAENMLQIYEQNSMLFDKIIPAWEARLFFENWLDMEAVTPENAHILKKIFQDIVWVNILIAGGPEQYNETRVAWKNRISQTESRLLLNMSILSGKHERAFPLVLN